MTKSRMMSSVRALGVALAGAAGLAGLPSGVMAADVAHPVVVELFQSQGCSSCPPANANFLIIADRPDVLALSWQVTYWDELGWKDTFAKPAFTARQWDYAHAFHRGEVATPEIVVDGRSDVVGSDRAALDRLIRDADRGDGGPKIKIDPNHVSIDGVGSGEVLLVRYDPAIQQVPIRRGENGGKTLPHRNVVREVIRLGTWKGGSSLYAMPAVERSGLKTAILVQAGPGGPILAAARG